MKTVLMAATSILCITVGLTATVAQAHPRMNVSIPAPGATVKNSPSEIKLGFSERLVIGFTGLDLTDSNGKTVQTGKSSLVPGDKTKFVVPIRQRLTPGTYNVAWHVVSADTHRVTGKYSFKVAR